MVKTLILPKIMVKYMLDYDRRLFESICSNRQFETHNNQIQRTTHKPQPNKILNTKCTFLASDTQRLYAYGLQSDTCKT